MCSGAFSLQSQLDFHRSSDSQKGGKMVPRMHSFEVQNPHYTPLGGPWSDLGSDFCSSETMRKKWSEKKRVDAPFWASRRNAQRQWGVGGENIKQNYILSLTRLVPLLRTEDGAADSKRYVHSAGPAKYFEDARISRGRYCFQLLFFVAQDRKIMRNWRAKPSKIMFKWCWKCYFQGWRPCLEQDGSQSSF